MAAGEPADINRLKSGIDTLTTSYRRLGYFGARLEATGVVREAGRTVACRVQVIEGPRFRYRRLALVGLEPELAARIRSRWTLQEGQYYDGGYARRFVSEVREAERAALAGRSTITIREVPDEAATTVDLVLEFTRSER